uniref:Uncharacterized protein n=1 Tax=Aegilops tauschii subsp. strangulata TaxID=200361 RepID=A0A453FJ02_AEGTS
MGHRDIFVLGPPLVLPQCYVPSNRCLLGSCSL